MAIKITKISFKRLIISLKWSLKSFKRDLICFELHTYSYFNFYSGKYLKEKVTSFRRHVCRFNFFSVFPVLISILSFIVKTTYYVVLKI